MKLSKTQQKIYDELKKGGMLEWYKGGLGGTTALRDSHGELKTIRVGSFTALERQELLEEFYSDHRVVRYRLKDEETD